MTALQSQPLSVVLLPERFRACCAFGGGFFRVNTMILQIAGADYMLAND
ncbi:hypothetical protein [Kaarinaea lacus]